MRRKKSGPSIAKSTDTGPISAVERCAAQRAARGMSGRSVPTKAPPSAHVVAVPIPRHTCTWGAQPTRRLNKHKLTNLKSKCLIARHLKPSKNKKAKKYMSLQNKWKQSRLPKRPKPQPTPQNQRVRRKMDNKRVGSQKGLHKASNSKEAPVQLEKTPSPPKRPTQILFLNLYLHLSFYRYLHQDLLGAII